MLVSCFLCLRWFNRLRRLPAPVAHQAHPVRECRTGMQLRLHQPHKGLDVLYVLLRCHLLGKVIGPSTLLVCVLRTSLTICSSSASVKCHCGSRIAG